MTIHISDKAEEFRIEVIGRFADSWVGEAETAWKAALLVNTPRRISVDITRMTGYDRPGFLLLREMHVHGTHIAAGTPRSLLFLNQISGPARKLGFAMLDQESQQAKRTASKRVLTMPSRAAASGE